MTIERHDPESGLKIVPMFIEGEDEPADAAPPVPADRRRTPLLGILALVLAAFTVAALIVGIVVSSAGDYGTGTTLAYGAIGLSVLAVVAGVTALILGMGRRSGVIGVIAGVVANPLVLLLVLRFIGGVQAG
ncbi:MAG: hypothetical protein ABJA94_08675 [Rhodoglobus sp.]